MPYINCYVDDRTMAILERESTVRQCSVRTLAEKAIESCAISTLPGGVPVPGFDGQYFESSIFDAPRLGTHRLDLGSCSIGLQERPDGSINITP